MLEEQDYKKIGEVFDKKFDEKTGQLEENIVKKKGFKYFLRAVTRWKGGIYATRTTGAQGSGVLRSMALADSLMVLPEETGYIKKGAVVTVRFLK